VRDRIFLGRAHVKYGFTLIGKYPLDFFGRHLRRLLTGLPESGLMNS
jgi:hypothetical protein